MKGLLTGETNNDTSHVTSLEARRNNGFNQGKDILPEEDSLGELLIHMRRVREAVPVNERLKSELKARLAAFQAESAASRPQLESAAAGNNGWFSVLLRPWLLWLLPAALLMALLGIWWANAAPKTIEAGQTREICRFWSEESPLQFACFPQAKGFLVVRDGRLYLLDQYGNGSGVVKPPAGQSYAYPALTRSGDMLALVRRHDTGVEEIVAVSIPAGTPDAGEGQQMEMEAALSEAQTILRVDQGMRLSGLAWSPDGQTLAYSLGEPGKENIIFIMAKGGTPESLGAGGSPAWSPDGARLVVERAGEGGRPELWLTGPQTVEFRLAEGGLPAWSPKGYLAFVRVNITERVLAFRPDGSPLFTVRQPQGEIRVLCLGRKGELGPASRNGQPVSGDRLLLAPDTGPGKDELNWLRRLELEGAREPRTLLLSQINNYKGLSFSQDGKTLLVARREGEAAVLVQLNLSEKLVKGGDRL